MKLCLKPIQIMIENFTLLVLQSKYDTNSPNSELSDNVKWKLKRVHHGPDVKALSTASFK